MTKTMKERVKQGNQAHQSKVENSGFHDDQEETKWNAMEWRGEHPQN